MRFAIAVPVGPDPAELSRLRSLIESLQAFVGTDGRLVVLDDAGVSRREELERACRPRQVVTLATPRLPAEGGPNDRMAASTMTFLQWLADSDCDYALKLDTDALVVGDFRAALETAFRDPTLGVCGACDRNSPGGAQRDWAVWRGQLLLACLPVQARVRSGRPELHTAFGGTPGRRRRTIGRAIISARRHGYRLGEHCLGGAYGVSAEATRALSRRGALRDPLVSLGTGLSEDVLIGLLVRSAGYRLCSLVDRGQPFALKHRGLLSSPENLVAKGYSIVHSVKSDDPASEQATVDHFRRLRGTDPAR